jgi:hypothetical protein
MAWNRPIGRLLFFSPPFRTGSDRKKTSSGPISALFPGFFLFAIQENPYFPLEIDGAGSPNRLKPAS